MRLSLSNVTVRRGGFTLGPLNYSIDTEIPEIIMVIGPNGAGKTTLLKAVAGFITMDDGKISIDDVELSSLPPQKRRVGYVSQEPYLFPNLTVEENVRYGAEQSDGSFSYANELMAELEIEHLARRKPTTLSGGEQQRVSIARALATRPRLLLFDEPFSHLDRHVQEQLREVVKRIIHKDKVSSLYVTHNVEEAYSLADRLLFIDQGHFVETVFPGVAAANIDKSGENQRPRSRKFAELLGFRNFISGQIIASHDGIVDLKVGDLVLEGIGEENVGIEATMTVRPEDIAISIHEPSYLSQRNALQVNVFRFVSRGPLTEVIVENKKSKIRMTALLTTSSLADLCIKEGDNVYAIFKATAAHIVCE